MREHSADLDALRVRVHITLVHEIGNYFGLDDARLRELGWAQPAATPHRQEASGQPPRAATGRAPRS